MSVSMARTVTIARTVMMAMTVFALDPAAKLI